MTDTKWKPVIVESPYAGDIAWNVGYARKAYRDCLYRGEAPFASHLNYTQDGVLNDDDPKERKMGIEAGLAIGKMFKTSVFYVDLGFSDGMRQGYKAAFQAGRETIFRHFGKGEKAVEIPHREALEIFDLRKLNQRAYRLEIPHDVAKNLKFAEVNTGEEIDVYKIIRKVQGEAIRIAAELVRLPDLTPDRGDPAYDYRQEVVSREAVVELAMQLKKLETVDDS